MNNNILHNGLILSIVVTATVSIAVASEPLVNIPSAQNSTVANFERIDLVNGDNFFKLLPGRILQNAYYRWLLNVQHNTIQDPPYALSILSQHGGLKSKANNYAIKGTAASDIDNFFGRVGVQGSVSTNGSASASGYVGFLEYDPELDAQVEGNIDPDTLVGPNIDYLRITDGNPFAFYTRGNSKFNGTSEIAGNIASDSGNITIQDPVTIEGSSPATPAELTADALSASDVTTTDDLSGRILVRSGTYTLGANSTLKVGIATASCPANSIRLSCYGRLGNDATTLKSNYLGAKPNGLNECKSYAIHPVAATVPAPGSLYAYAVCYQQ